jgi:hypothetical protein
MKNILAKLNLMKVPGCRPQGKALDLLNALSGADFACGLKAMQACVERRFPNRTLSCRAGVRDVEPGKRHCHDIRRITA